MASGGDGDDPHGNKRRIGAVYVDQLGVTELDNEDVFSFLWIIKHFSEFGNAVITSPVYSGGTKCHRWQLRAQKNQFGFAKEEHLSLHLSLLGFGDSCFCWLPLIGDLAERKLKAKIQLNLLDGEGHAIHQIGSDRDPSVVDLKIGDSYGKKQFIPISALDQSRCPNDTVKILCKLQYYEGTRRRIVQDGDNWD